MMSKKHSFVLAGAAAVCVLVLIGAGRYCLGARAAAADEARNLVECRRLIGQITALRDQPEIAEAEELEPTALTHQIEAARAAADIPADALIRILPQPSRAVGDSGYSQVATEVLINDVTLRQLVHFLIEVTQGEGQLSVTRLRLSGDRGSVVGEIWDSEVTLTYLVYDSARVAPDQRR